MGRHVVPELLARGHRVHAISRDREKAESMPWWGRVRHTAADIHQSDLDIVAECGLPDVLIHLAWPGLPHYGPSLISKIPFLLITGLSGEWYFQG